LAALLLAAMLWPVTPLAAAEPVVTKEYQVKAAFLYHFTKFVEWPAEKFATTNAPIVIGVLGRSPFGLALEEVVKDRKVNGRAIQIKSVKAATEIQGLHVLFVGAAEDNRMAEVAPALRVGSVLGVGESPTFLALGGMIRFALEGDKTRFDINMVAADLAQLKVSAPLQHLAREVKKKVEASLPSR
jgi:hypothetical protein